MIKYVFTIIAVLLLSGCTGTLSPGVQAGLANTCQSSTNFYGLFSAAAATGVVKESLKLKVDQAWSVLQPICDKGPAATQTDIVIAAAQAYIIVKAWRDAA
jgi:hypothetical protein